MNYKPKKKRSNENNDTNNNPTKKTRAENDVIDATPASIPPSHPTITVVDEANENVATTTTTDEQQPETPQNVIPTPKYVYVGKGETEEEAKNDTSQ